MNIEEERVTITTDDNAGEQSTKNYSVDMIETMFSDSLARGMQNAIISQQNAQMASSASITNACARILQARAEPSESANPSQISKPAEASSPAAGSKSEKVTSVKVNGTSHGISEVTIVKRMTTSTVKSVSKLLTAIKSKFTWLAVFIAAAVLFLLIEHFQPEIEAISSLIKKERSQEQATDKDVAKDTNKAEPVTTN